MSKKTRFVLFIILAVLFFIAAPTVLLYSWGYRFDWQTKKITQTGGFYFKVWPKPALVYLNGKERKKTGFFSGAAYLDKLLPKKYTVEITKEGFQPWKKTLEIKEKQVTDAKNIILLPQKPQFNILSKNVETFFISPDQKQMILKEREEGGWSLKLWEFDNNLKSHLVSQNQLGKLSVEEFLNSFFSQGTTTTSSPPKETLKEPYYLDKEKEILYLRDQKSDSLEKIFERTKDAKLSPDLKKLVYFSESELWVLFLQQEIGQPQKSAGEKVFIARFSEKIGDVFWLNNHYLVFNVANKIKVAEIDDRDSINMVDLAEFKDPKIFWDKNNKKLYVLSEGNLAVLANLTP
jgi:hypothetical protein